MIIETLYETAIIAQDTTKTIAEKTGLGEVTFDLSKINEGDGLFISFVGYAIVFLALLILFIFVSNLKNILSLNQRKKLKASGHKAADIEDLNISDEINAAIATAIHLYYAEVHDFEATVLTISKVQKPYSPWSSKLYGLRQTPKK